MKPWYEDETLWHELTPILTSREAIRSAREEVERAVRLLQVSPGARILDLGCGPGRHTAAFAELGYRVTGVDLTISYLKLSQERTRSIEGEVELAQQGMLRFKRETAFDGAVSLLTSFGYCEDVEDDLLVLRNIHDSLRPGGRVLIDIMGTEVIAANFQPLHWQSAGERRFWL